MLTTITNFLKQIIGLILSILPRSPFRSFIDDLAVSEWLGVLNWFVPVGTLLSIATAWGVAIGVFYAYQLILRWSKAVGD